MQKIIKYKTPTPLGAEQTNPKHQGKAHRKSSVFASYGMPAKTEQGRGISIGGGGEQLRRPSSWCSLLTSWISLTNGTIRRALPGRT